MPSDELTGPPRRSLVLVLGAGASKEANLPTGDELKPLVAKALNFRPEGGYDIVGGDERIVEAFRQLARGPDGRYGDIHQYLQAAWLIRDAMPQALSIDNFIDSHRDDGLVAQCGKLAIAACILSAEAKSNLRVNRNNVYKRLNFSSVAGTWFDLFFKLLAENCQRGGLQARLRRVAVISFNYDRCLEHFLYESLRNYYSLSEEDAAALLSEFEIYHAYGTVGPLPWSKMPSSIEYGGQPRTKELSELAKKLRTFTEGTDETESDIKTIRAILHSAERTVFLGFAFHPLNLELLYGPKATRARTDKVYATAWGLSESNAELIAAELSAMAGYALSDIHLRRDLTAAQLIPEFWRSLSIRA